MSEGERAAVIELQFWVTGLGASRGGSFSFHCTFTSSLRMGCVHTCVRVLLGSFFPRLSFPPKWVPGRSTVISSPRI